MFSSTIIPTINRPTLSHAVRSVLDQHFDADDMEVIVVNDSGQPLPEMDWQHSGQVRVIDTNHRERSTARNTGAAIAKGEYLHFLDDDDLLLPGALEAFWKLKGHTKAVWLSGSYQTVDNCGNLVEVVHPNVNGNIFSLLVAGESLPFQASLLRAEHFFSIGGFDSDPAVLGVEDRDVGRRLATCGQVMNSPAIVAQIRIGELGSTTDWRAIAERDRWGREKAMNLPRSYAHARVSTSTCLSGGQTRQAYWRGRVCRAYVASAVWNLQRKNVLIAASRGIAGLTLASWSIFQPDFFQGLKRVR